VYIHNPDAFHKQAAALRDAVTRRKFTGMNSSSSDLSILRHSGDIWAPAGQSGGWPARGPEPAGGKFPLCRGKSHSAMAGA